ncbi:MAG: hypothetical protein H7X97_07075 [Opitutaceae bacterium]|nr:hypothetical protein [Verrucomicrobiales bacterium]
MNRSYLISKTVTLPASGALVPADVSGSFFRCYRATAGQFQMSFDGEQFFEFEKGLRFRLVEADNYVKLWLRILPGTSTQNTVSFYYGTAEVEDNRLNIIDNEDAATLYVRPQVVFPDFNTDLQVAMADGDWQIIPAHPGRAYFDIDAGAGDTDRGVDVLILDAAGVSWNQVARVVRGTSGRRFDFTSSYRLENNSGAALRVSSLSYYYAG